jgi:hypothetical protein
MFIVGVEDGMSNSEKICKKAVPGMFESGNAIWEDGGERDALAYVGADWDNVRKYDKRVVAYERKLRKKGLSQ